MRNMTVNYRGGAYSRAGTSFVGFSRQTGRAYPPRVIGYEFSVQQGLMLEFGHHYMRVVSNGAFVTSGSFPVLNITQASPAVMTVDAVGVSSAAPTGSGVVLAYNPGDTITVAGGSFVRAATLSVTSVSVTALSVYLPGAGYARADPITLSGGVATTAAIATVYRTQVAPSPTLFAAGSGGATDGAAVFAGTTGVGTFFQVNVTVAGGAVSAVGSLVTGGVYSTNPVSLTAEPIVYVSGAGAGLTGAKLTVAMGVQSVTITTAGVYTTSPSGGVFGQSASSGGGTGVGFNGAVLAPYALALVDPGVYATPPSNPAAQSATSGAGQGAQFNLTYLATSPFASGDWVFLNGISGMTPVDQETYSVVELTPSTFALYDAYGAPVDSTAFPAYLSGGTAAAIYTLSTINDEKYLEYLKITQSADVASLTCVNQVTGTEYPPQDLSRVADDNWSFAVVNAVPTVSPPSGTPTGVASSAGAANYAYVVTAVNPTDGSESVASQICHVSNAVDNASTAGSITISWNSVAGVNEYNIYRAAISYDVPVPGGALFGYAGSAYGTSFVDGNIVPDFTQTPPTHQNPFARGQVLSAPLISGGAGYTAATAAITSGTGSGAVVNVVVNVTLTPGSGQATVGPGPVSALLIEDAGSSYQTGDLVTISGDGAGALATLKVGPETGTYPGVVSYFQQRRVYGYTQNNPNTYFMSQPGSYTNFDTRIPTIASDAITGTPWSLQVNGLQWLVPTAPGLLVMTGQSAWLIAGVGSFATNVQAITPSTQNAIPQAFSGCAATIPPIKVNYSVLYVESKQSLYYELPYQLYALSEPIDLTENSSHLFTGYSIREHAWCEQPNKILWSVRSDGILLSLTYLKAQQVAGWARHDTQGYFKSVCSITEPPVDALYCATQRSPGGKNAYFIERMDNRVWPGVENCWCVDAGLALPQPTPNATLTASSATGLGSVTGFTNVVGGANYSAATTAWIVDANGEGPGVGAVVVVTVGLGGVLSFSLSSNGAGYVSPALVVQDPENLGSGASASPVLNNSATFTASAPVFSAQSVGGVIRVGGGIAAVTGLNSTSQVVANILSPIITTVPNSGGVPAPQTAGNWTLTTPVTKVSGLGHLIGATVTGLADGNVIPPTVVAADGSITLAAAASAVTVGLGFTAQIQSVYIDAGEPTVQGQRAKIAAVTARLEASQGVTAGANQTDGSTLSPAQVAPAWGAGGSLTAVPSTAVRPYNALATPLSTGDVRVPVFGGWDSKKQVALQQTNPLPLQVLAFISELEGGDTPEVKASPQPPNRGRK